MSIADTIRAIVEARSWTQRIAQIRLVPHRHGSNDHTEIYAAAARELYMPHLAPDFAYIHEAPFYDTVHFFAAYEAAARLTEGFARVAEADIAECLRQCPSTLLVFRTLLGLTKDEFSHSTMLAVAALDLPALSAGQVDAMERGDATGARELRGAALERLRARAQVAAKTIVVVMDGELFGDPPAGLRTKQQKPDTVNGWASVQEYAAAGVPLKVLLHQRHYGGAFRQVLDATSTQRGDLIEDAVEALFTAHGVSFIRTGSHNQAEVAARFEVRVTPAPDFVVFDPVEGGLKAMLECKGTNNGGTARDKALRFTRLKSEAMRLNGVPLFAVLGGIGWARINDALGPVVRDTDGRVFTLSTLNAMLEVAPFSGMLSEAT